MKTTELQASHNQELKRLFLKVFSSDPWFDK